MNDGNLYALFRSRSPRDRNSTFLKDEAGSRLTYGELDEETGRITGFLKEVGIVKGDRIVAQVEKSPEAVLLYLACLRCGAVYVPLNTAYTVTEVSYVINDAAPKLLVCVPEAGDEFKPEADKAGVAHILTLDEQGQGSLMDGSRRQNLDSEVADVKANETAAILYTSGTTGRPKGAMLSHENLASNALTLYDYWGWRTDDVLLHALPIFHVHGLFVALHCALLGGSSVWFLPRFDTNTVIRLLPHSSVMMGVPTFYGRLLEHPEFNESCCRSMRLFISGSAPLLVDTFNQFEQRTGHRILERYGMTEAGMITSNPLQGERIAGTVGFPLPGVQVRIVDEQGKSLDKDTVGVLELKGPNVFTGYWRMPEKTREEFRDDGYFISGDLAKIDADGRVTIAGRTKDLVISGGYNVYPKEVETVIDSIDGVDESAVFGVPHPDFGEAVVGVLVMDHANLKESDILEALSGKLARFKQPKRVFFVEQLPRNAMGKVVKNQLRDRFRDVFR